MATMQQARPSWYTKDDDSAWERVKAAFQRDWQQTKHDFGGDEPDLNQDVTDTVSQATGNKPIPPANAPTRHPEAPEQDVDTYQETNESAYRYGYSAYRHFGTECEWCDDTEARLRRDWNNDAEWERQRASVQRGWRYAEQHPEVR